MCPACRQARRSVCSFELKEFARARQTTSNLSNSWKSTRIDLGLSSRLRRKSLGQPCATPMRVGLSSIHPAYLQNFKAHGIRGTLGMLVQSGVTIHWVDSVCGYRQGHQTSPCTKAGWWYHWKLWSTRIHEAEYKLYQEVSRGVGQNTQWKMVGNILAINLVIVLRLYWQFLLPRVSLLEILTVILGVLVIIYYTLWKRIA